MNAAYGSSGYFVSRVRSKSIVNTTYACRRSNFPSKTTPINGPVHKSNLNYSSFRSHFSRLPQAVAKRLSFRLSQKVSCYFKNIYPVINGFSTHEVRSHLHIFDHSIVTFVVRRLGLGFLNTSQVDSLDRFRQSVVDKVITELCFFKISFKIN